MSDLLSGNVLSALGSQRYIAGLTHRFYRYPASSPPDLVRQLILDLTEPGDLVIDPFVGGGTSVVEAIAHGRRAIGYDLNSLAVFVTRVKTRPMSRTSWKRVFEWADRTPLKVIHRSQRDPDAPKDLPRSLRAPLSAALDALRSLEGSEKAAARCALLRLGQWSLESRDQFPTVDQLSLKLEQLLAAMERGMAELVASARNYGVPKSQLVGRRDLVRLAAEDHERVVSRFPDSVGKGRLVLTSPPYPGVHVLYSRWQVAGRRETSAPYWVSSTPDGQVPSYYTMGPRSKRGIDQYFARITDAFTALRPLLSKAAVVAQVVGFNDAATQFPRYLSSMNAAGYERIGSGAAASRVRRVPNRRWYARGRDFDAGREVLLLHRPR